MWCCPYSWYMYCQRKHANRLVLSTKAC
jgi:hypothetical protein